MSHRPKRHRAGFGGAKNTKMTAEEYEELIGRHKHIEHKALNSEIAKELGAFTQNRPSRTIVNNNILYPPQPPPLPKEANRNTNTQFIRSTPWPKYSVIQRAAHMYFNSRFPIKTITKFLESMKISQVQINIAFEVHELMEQSVAYWRKVHYLQDAYTQRYDDKTRQYALTNAIWSLQIGMTLHAFHLDHIVDIVYKKDLWSADYDIQYEKEQVEKLKSIRMPQPHSHSHAQMQDEKYNGCGFDDSNFDTTSYEEEYDETTSEELHNILGQDDMMNMSKEEFLKNVQQVKEQVKEQGLDELFSFGNIYKGVPAVGRDGKPVVIASNFENGLNDEKTQFDGGGGSLNSKDLNGLYMKYPNVDRGLIRQTYFQENENFDLTVFQLDDMENKVNKFYGHQEQGK